MTADKQWIEDRQATCVKIGKETLFTRKVDGQWSNCIMKLSLLDQLRRDERSSQLKLTAQAVVEAKKELLNNLTPLIKKHLQITRISFGRISGQLTADELEKYNRSVELIEYELDKRAKTLGENVK